MRFLKRKFVTIYLAIASLLGYQVVRDPVLDVSNQNQVALPSATPSEVTPSSRIEMQELGITGATFDEAFLVRKAIESGNAILNSECVKNRILGAPFTETNGLSNREILNLLLTKKMTFKVHIYYGSWSENYIYKTVGKDIGDGTVYMNRFFVKDEKTMRSLAFHEALHQLGFSHFKVKATSVPYQGNLIIEECGDALGI